MKVARKTDDKLSVIKQLFVLRNASVLRLHSFSGYACAENGLCMKFSLVMSKFEVCLPVKLCPWC